VLGRGSQSEPVELDLLRLPQDHRDGIHRHSDLRRETENYFASVMLS
jgi:hypothetical protein